MKQISESETQFAQLLKEALADADIDSSGWELTHIIRGSAPLLNHEELVATQSLFQKDSLTWPEFKRCMLLLGVKALKLSFETDVKGQGLYHDMCYMKLVA